MPRRMFDPFSSEQAPGYAIESDSEQSDFDDPAAGPVPRARVPSKQINNSKPTVKWIPTEAATTSLPPSHSQDILIIVGEAGELWEVGLAKNSLEQIGLFSVVDSTGGDDYGDGHDDSRNAGTPIASVNICKSKNTSPPVVCVTASISLYALHSVAESFITLLKPSSITIIDSYPIFSYFTSDGGVQGTYDSQPGRYLTTSTTTLKNSSTLSEFKPHQPPNLIEGISASIMTIAESLLHTQALLLLIPSPIPPQSSTTLSWKPNLRPPPLDEIVINSSASSVLSNCDKITNWSSQFNWQTPTLKLIDNRNKSSYPSSFKEQSGYAFLRSWRKSEARNRAKHVQNMYT